MIACSVDKFQAEGSFNQPLRCNFCHKTSDNVKRLIGNPDDYDEQVKSFPGVVIKFRAHICDECVGECVKMLKKDQGQTAG